MRKNKHFGNVVKITLPGKHLDTDLCTEEPMRMVHKGQLRAESIMKMEDLMARNVHMKTENPMVKNVHMKAENPMVKSVPMKAENPMARNVLLMIESPMARNVPLMIESPMTRNVPMEIENLMANIRITRIGNHTVIKSLMESKDHTVKEILIVNPKRMEIENHMVTIMKDAKIKSLCPFVILNMDTFIY